MVPACTQTTQLHKHIDSNYWTLQQGNAHRVEANAKAARLAGLCALDAVANAADGLVVLLAEGCVVVRQQRRALQLCQAAEGEALCSAHGVRCVRAVANTEICCTQAAPLGCSLKSRQSLMVVAPASSAFWDTAWSEQLSSGVCALSIHTPG